MNRTTSWHVEIQLMEDDTHTKAVAVLQTDAGEKVRHEGMARRNPADPLVPKIGEELATARALSGLAHDLFEAAVGDVERNVQHPVQLNP